MGRTLKRALTALSPPFAAVLAMPSPSLARAVQSYEIPVIEALTGSGAGLCDFEKTPQRGLDVSDAVVTRWSPKAQRWQPVSRLGGAPIDRLGGAPIES